MRKHSGCIGGRWKVLLQATVVSDHWGPEGYASLNGVFSAPLTAASPPGTASGGRRGTYDASRIPPITTSASDPMPSSATGGNRRPPAAGAPVTAALTVSLTGSPPAS